MSRVPIVAAIFLIGFLMLRFVGINTAAGSATNLPSGLSEAERLGVIALPVSSPIVDGARYKIDTARSHFTVRAFAGGLLSALAHNHTIAVRDFSGETEFTYGTFEPAALRMTVKAGSLAVTDKVSDKDRGEIEQRMREQVLETANYPEIAFVSTSVSATKSAEGQYQLQIHGKLTLHGESRQVTIPTKVELGADSLRARGEIAVKQSDYHIKPVSIGGGTIKVKDEVKLSFDITAHK